MSTHLARALTVFTLLFAAPLGAGASDGPQSIESLRHLSQSIEALVTSGQLRRLTVFPEPGNAPLFALLEKP